jgi:transcriptional regulator with XRE-family HTH domain
MLTEVNRRFGRFLADKRLDIPLKQVEVAQRVGISQAHISAIELGNRSVTLDLALRICNALGADMCEFIESEIDNEKTLAV